MIIRRVLFVCSGNTCRSPMAARLLEHMWQQSSPGWELHVASAGTNAFAGLEASSQALTTMHERGLDLTDHRSQALSEVLLAQSDVVLTMADQHKALIHLLWPAYAAKVFTVGEYGGAGEEISDPFGGPVSAYQRTAADLERLMARIVVRIRKEGSSNR